jgi:hypothetical protein
MQAECQDESNPERDSTCSRSRVSWAHFSSSLPTMFSVFDSLTMRCMQCQSLKHDIVSCTSWKHDIPHKDCWSTTVQPDIV